MKQSQFLRKITDKPVIFFYNTDNDTVPTVLVCKFHHDELNPGFSGINLNYIDPFLKRTVLQNAKPYLQQGESLPQSIIDMCPNAYRRYNYNKIQKFLYRGNKQDHERS